eukprot:1978206-Rhodomonas_salina.2
MRRARRDSRPRQDPLDAPHRSGALSVRYPGGTCGEVAPNGNPSVHGNPLHAQENPLHAQDRHCPGQSLDLTRFNRWLGWQGRPGGGSRERWARCIHREIKYKTPRSLFASD